MANTTNRSKPPHRSSTSPSAHAQQLHLYHRLHINILSTDTVLDQTLDESIPVEMSRFLVRLNYDGIQDIRLILEQFSSRP
jgi:hypothetical protein